MNWSGVPDFIRKVNPWDVPTDQYAKSARINYWRRVGSGHEKAVHSVCPRGSAGRVSGDQKCIPARNGVNDPWMDRNVGLFETRGVITVGLPTVFVGFATNAHEFPSRTQTVSLSVSESAGRITVNTLTIRRRRCCSLRCGGRLSHRILDRFTIRRKFHVSGLWPVNELLNQSRGKRPLNQLSVGCLELSKNRLHDRSNVFIRRLDRWLVQR